MCQVADDVGNGARDAMIGQIPGEWGKRGKGGKPTDRSAAPGHAKLEGAVEGEMLRL